MFMEKNNNEINNDQVVEEPHFGIQRENFHTSAIQAPPLGVSQTNDDGLVFDQSISISKNKFEVIHKDQIDHQEQAVGLDFDNFTNLLNDRMETQMANKTTHQTN